MYLNKKRNLVFGLLFKFLLDYSYFSIVSKYYSYQGFYLNINPINYFVSFLIVILFLSILSEKIKSVSDLFLSIAIFTVIIPISTLFGLDDERSILPLIYCISSILIIIFVSKVKIKKIKKIPIIKNGENISLYISLVFVLFLIFWYFISGVELNLNLRKVYEFREENAELSSIGLLSYTNNWTYKIFNIFIILYALKYKKYGICVIFLLCQVYFFSATAHKSVLFLPFIVIIIYLILSKTRSSYLIPLGLIILQLITFIFYYFFDNLFVSAMFSRRVFFIPSHLTYSYIDFFQNNPHIYWSNSILSSFSEYPYHLPLSNLIGEYNGDSRNSANNGFISTGFAHAGLFGIVLYSIMIGFLIRVMNFLISNGVDSTLTLTLILLPLRSLLVSTDFFTAMLTHGLIIIILLLYMLRDKIVKN